MISLQNISGFSHWYPVMPQGYFTVCIFESGTEFHELNLLYPLPQIMFHMAKTLHTTSTYIVLCMQDWVRSEDTKWKAMGRTRLTIIFYLGLNFFKKILNKSVANT